MTPDEVFELGLTFVLKAEGGFSNDPQDAGGPTSCGITSRVYSAWLKEKSMPDAPITQISSQEVRQIYKEEYWDQAKLDQFVAAGCSPKVAIALFDCGVNTGVGRSVKLLQAALGVATDGIMGHDTMNGTLAYPHGPDMLLTQVLNRRRTYYNALASQNKNDQKFIHGWLNRIDNLTNYLEGLS